MTAPARTDDRQLVEGFVEADGFRIRYRASGAGRPLVHLPGGHGLVLTPAHDALSEHRRVIAFEMPGFGESAENTRTATIDELARTMLAAITALGIDDFDLVGTSFGAKVACCTAILAPARVGSLILEAPGAIRPESWTFPDSTEQRARPQDVDAETRQKMRRLVQRLLGPNRDTAFEERLRSLATPTLVLLGTVDRTLDTAAVGHIYKELLPNCSLVYVYDAGHAISSERPQAFAEVVADYLERQQIFVVNQRPTVIFP